MTWDFSRSLKTLSFKCSLFIQRKLTEKVLSLKDNITQTFQSNEILLNLIGVQPKLNAVDFFFFLIWECIAFVTNTVIEEEVETDSFIYYIIFHK